MNEFSAGQKLVLAPMGTIIIVDFSVIDGNI